MAGVDVGGNDSFSLNLYPMLDVFSILIVFLLMNFSVSGESAEVSANLELPMSSVKVSLDSAAAVAITRTEIVIQGGLKIPLTPNAQDVVEAYKKDGQGAIRAAYDEFKKLKAQNDTLKNRQKNLALTNSDVSTLVMQSDKTIPYRIIKRVLASAQQAEFIAWKFAVQKRDVN
jgi:biopolymer transport protein TolR